eukprot:4216533-Ditylum_brightwellii.AAC.1
MPYINTRFYPLDIFSGTTSDHTELFNSHVWGCPAYVLDPMLQDGEKLPKCYLCKHCGQYPGWIKHHESYVALIRNLRTGTITPHFHTVMDDWFTTIARIDTNNNFVAPKNWEDLFKFDRLNLLVDWNPVLLCPGPTSRPPHPGPTY